MLIVKKFYRCVFTLSTTLVLAACGIDPTANESRNQRVTIEYVTTTASSGSSDAQKTEVKDDTPNQDLKSPSVPSCVLAADSAAVYLGEHVQFKVSSTGVPKQMFFNQESIDPETATLSRTIDKAGSNFFELKVSNDLGEATCLVMLIGVEK